MAFCHQTMSSCGLLLLVVCFMNIYWTVCQVQGDQAGQFSLDEFQHFLSVSGEGEGIVDPVFVDHEVRGTVQAANFEQC